MNPSNDDSATRKDVAYLSARLVKNEWSDAATFASSRPHVLCERMHVPYQQLSGWNGMPFLNYAAMFAPVECVKALLDAGAPLEGRDENRRTPLLRAISRSVKPPAPKDDGRQVVELLLERGARCDAVDKSGVSPVYTLAAELDSVLVRRLIERGAPLNTRKDVSDPTPSVSVLTSEYLVHGGSGRRQALQAIVEGGVDLNPWVPSINEAPLAQALWLQDKAVAELMCAHGARVLARDGRGRTLMFAAQHDHAVAWLLDKEPSLLEARDHEGVTPLMHHVASALQHPQVPTHSAEVAKVLILRGADLDAVDDQGPGLSRTPRQMIQEGGHDALKEFLRYWHAQEVARAALRDVTPRP